MTDTVRVCSGGGVLLSKRRASSLSLRQMRFFHVYSNSSLSESDGCGVSNEWIGDEDRRFRELSVVVSSTSEI